jgi:predicted transcriptional regulator
MKSIHATRRRKYHSGSAGTLVGLTTPSRLSHCANFNQILPKTLKMLVDEGLFEPNENVEGGYRITTLGLERLKDISTTH